MPDAHDHHDHDHGHAHPHAHTPAVIDEPIDPAQQSLADALRVSFGILKFIMYGLVVVYLFSGLYQVQPQQQAVQLVFGKIVGEGENRVKQQGWHLGWPFPIGEVVRVPTTTLPLSLDSEFMFQIAERDRTKSFDDMTGRALNPEVDGSLITADANLVHAGFNVNYRITDADRFVTHIGDFYNDRDHARLESLLRVVLSEAIVRTTAKTISDDFIAGRAGLATVRDTAQEILDNLVGDGGGVGITLNEVTIDQPTMPLAVRGAYNLVSQAESRRNELVNQAQTARRETLGGAAGAAALPAAGGSDGPLVALIKEYELASAAGDAQKLQAIGDQLDAAFRTLKLDADDRTYSIGGEAAGVINRAQTQRTALVQGIEADAEAFAKLLKSWRANPALVRQLEWQRARSEIFGEGSDIETFLAPKGQLYVELNRDPEITRQRERDRIQKERAARDSQ